MAGPVVRGLLRPAPFGDCDDPDAAPGAHRGASTAPQHSWRRVRLNLFWIYVFGLVFLIFAIPGITEGVGPAGLALRIGYLVVLGLGYVGAAWVSDATLRVRWCYVGGFAAFVLGGELLWGWGFASFGVYPAVLIASLLPWRQSRFALLGWGLLLATIGLIGGQWTPVYMAVLAVGIGLAMAGGIESSRITRMLEHAQTRVDTLSVAAERERISRDLHDILGHSLTAITIKSSLAARLADTDPAAAKVQMSAVEAIARQALADVRATASGLTEIRLATEIASARSVLLAAGVDARTPAGLPVLTQPVSELFGYVVRESVTNVVRHAEATWCAIEVDEDLVRISDDGVGLRSRGSGRGLSGLTDRVAAAGGTVEIEATPGHGTRVTARLAPAARPTQQPASQPARTAR